MVHRTLLGSYNFYPPNHPLAELIILAMIGDFNNNLLRYDAR